MEENKKCPTCGKEEFFKEETKIVKISRIGQETETDKETLYQCYNCGRENKPEELK